jgi:hypothetical protein
MRVNLGDRVELHSIDCRDARVKPLSQGSGGNPSE